MSYTAFDVSASALSKAFAESFEQMSNSADLEDCLPTFSAFHIMALATVCLGDPNRANKQFDQGRFMGLRLRLFGVDDPIRTDDFPINKSKELRGTAHAAWGAYSWQRYFLL
jgi:hypothetical protein